MKYNFLVIMLMLCATAKASDVRSFGEHDPLNTKAAFCEMAQNHTGTKTEMFYRTAGLFDILNVCRTKPKQVEKYDFDESIVKRIFVEEMDRREKYVQALPAEKQRAITRLDKIFENVRETYKGIPSYSISKYVYLFPEETNPKIIAGCSTILGTGRIYINPKSRLFDEYAHHIKSNVDIKDMGKQGAEKVNQVVADPKVSFFKKMMLKGALGIVNFGVRCSEDLVKSDQEEYEAALFHELSHPYTAKINNHLSKHTLSNESSENPCIERYCNTLAVLNSPHPLRTARNLKGCYHDEHLVALAKALKQEGVKE